MWVPVTTAWCVLTLRMEERPPIWRVAVNKLNKQPRTADEGWSPMNVGPCHHGMARPHVADGGKASNMEGSCE